ncbi:hypothetical protein GFY24_00630 [Nocardia sp. SYP-A9097]|uniref:hypothetical protein n=1 Tax=Nocardia sp. SYP-A9097 TaxID=2663237 RepID=UPI00129B513B|nr:hypothetical protein [Nocardia sp. SYP-A9097]MRH85982.1 hypothetical protein [Nocardia sp. SYP-A9097]
MITRTDTGGRIGEIRFTAIKALPTDCIAGIRTGITLAVQVEIVNGSGEQLPVPDVYQLKYVDSTGATRGVETASVYGCDADYPQAVTAAPGGATQGWLEVRLASAPTTLVYSPMVGDQSSTAGNIKMLTPAPATIRVGVPAAVSAGADASGDPVPTSETVSAPTVPMTTARASVPAPAPVAPPTGLDSQGRPTGTGGALVGCADENYQPGTGIFEDGSKGFAAECLPGGSMR